MPANSLTTENYLKAIYKLTEMEGGPISTNAIAGKMQTKASSVTDMLKKLSGKKLIHYRKYQGVTLTALGERTALGIIRKHRLWEMFLVEKLRFKWDEVHHIAEQLEHIDSDILIERIDQFLDHPKFDPHGDPIPDARGKLHDPKSKILLRFGVKSTLVMTGVVDHSPSFLQYLDRLGLSLGCSILIKEQNDYDQSMQVSVNGKRDIYISSEVAQNILVTKK